MDAMHDFSNFDGLFVDGDRRLTNFISASSDILTRVEEGWGGDTIPPAVFAVVVAIIILISIFSN